ncbi:metal-dependent amidohydrolase family protein [Emydomyces testavorans]|uniref:Dipeptidase n=1 Tax=Emydomyces testavorans TaxID=2070801 RepID=A0AAF0DMQ9_9EURO|nr:metal-dependent amidohydrolase family protein [Emydomyces testavorans]
MSTYDDIKQDPAKTQSGSSTSRKYIYAAGQSQQRTWIRKTVVFVSIAAVAATITRYIPFSSILGNPSSHIDPHDYAARADQILSTTPLIDGHNDLPYLIRLEMRNKIYDHKKFPFGTGLMCHTDEKKIREGKLGGQFWSVFVECPQDPAVGIDDPTWAVRDTLEQIDVTKRLVKEYPDLLQYCETPACARAAFRRGRVGSFLGIEGGHQIGNSLGSLRQMHDLGVRYITITHNCDNAFATAASTVAAGNPDGGLTDFGYEFIEEMNRLGMLIDLSHVSHQTMRDVLSVTKAPVIFSHSSSYALSQHLRNVPDDVLRDIAKNNGIVMVTFVPSFLKVDDPTSVTIHDAVNHIFHIAKVAGWDHVGVGSDFDGTVNVPKGLENVSKYPRLVELLLERGATDEQVRKFAGENLLRVWSDVEKVSQRINASGRKPNEATWPGRKWLELDVPMPSMFEDSKKGRVKGK